MNSHGCQLSPYAWHELLQTFLDHAWDSEIIILAIVVFSATVRGSAKKLPNIAGGELP